MSASIVSRLAEHIRVEPGFEASVRAAQRRGAVVFVLRNVSVLDYTALDALTHRLELPRLAFANDVPRWLPTALSSAHRGSVRDGLRLLAARGMAIPRRVDPEFLLRRALDEGRSAALFLKEASVGIGPSRSRGIVRGDDLLSATIALQKADLEREVMLLPLTFLWTMRPDRVGFRVRDILLGAADFPAELRAAVQTLAGDHQAQLRTGDLVSLRDFLGTTQASGYALLRQLTYALLRKVERERRAALGPAQKAPDRIREEVLRTPKLREAIALQARGDAVAERQLEQKARLMLKEMQATPDASTLEALEAAADALVNRVFDDVEVDEPGLERVREAARRGSIVLLPSHRSHVDYLLLSYVLRKHALPVPVVAAGDNLNFFPIGSLFRRAGAFFIRRKFSGDTLYKIVVDAYVRRLLRDGYAIEFFLEGGRSRTGKALRPKLGLLNMIVDAALHLEGRPVTFVPISIGYERMPEENAFSDELSGAEKTKESARALLSLEKVLRQTYGRANLEVGALVTLSEARVSFGLPDGRLSPGKRRTLVSKLADRVTYEINAAAAVTAGSLIALVVLASERRGIRHLDLVSQCERLASVLLERGARLTPSLASALESGRMNRAVRDAAWVFVKGGLLGQHVPGDTLTKRPRRLRPAAGDDQFYTVLPDKRLALDLSKNMLIHLFVDRALVATSALAAGVDAAREEIAERHLSLRQLFHFEFLFRTDIPEEDALSATIDAMVADGELRLSSERIGPGSGHHGLGGGAWLRFYAAVLKSSIESHRVVARTLRALQDGPLEREALIKRALGVGEQMFLAGEIDRAEAVSQANFESAIEAFVARGWLERREKAIALASPEARNDVAHVENEILRVGAPRGGPLAL